MGQLHEVLAVERELETTSKRLLAETCKTFSKENLFKGSTKKTIMFDAAEPEVDDEYIKLESTVFANLEYSSSETAKYWDAVLQKDNANCIARADIILDSKVLAADIPATFLLGLESKLNNLYSVFQAIPTLDPGREWKLDSTIGENIFKDTHVVSQFKTKKDIEFRVTYEATKEHKADIRELNITTSVGKINTTKWSGMISSAEKANMIKRLANLITAVKQARQRANRVDIVDAKIGTDLFNFIFYNK